MKKKGTFSSALALVSMAGIGLISTTLIGFLIGYHLDKYFGTRPWLLLLFIALGLIAGFRRLVRVADYLAEKEGE